MSSLEINPKFKDIRGKSITVRRNTTQTLPNGVITTLNYQTADGGYDPTVFELSNNGVLLKHPKIKTVMVIFNYQLTSTTTCISYLYKNSSQQYALSRANSDSGTMTGIVSAVQGNIIYSSVYTGGTSTTSNQIWNSMTVAILDIIN